ncbi:MAG: phosphatase [Deltaproteobacteria bacterium HGW-Deltaproteobacteria-14]|jgi:hypothetical protein|nr:MAG: phosphatase [Deltaproteobacteria bacterium HGW-Deltaproteobacteria-14]
MLRERISEHRARRRANQEIKAATRERFRIRLRRFAGHEVHAQQLDRPIRVAHLTDQHVGLVTPRKVQLAAIDIVNREQPDLVVLTGDFVCHSHAWLDELTELVRRFEAPVFGVLGNHDHWAGAKQVRRALRKGGVELLNNANTSITVARQRLQIVGLDDAYTGHANRDKAIKGLDARQPILGLSHIAEEADGLWNAGVPLVLSGHTHAGQLTIARLNEWTLGKIAKHRYIHGLYGARAGDGVHNGAVYVGAGIGAAVMPFRLGDRGNREVTIFELGARPGDLREHHDEQDFVPLPDDHDEEAARALAKERFVQRQAKKRKR